MSHTESRLRSAARPLAFGALALAVAGALALPQQAAASAFQLKENSAKSLGRAFAGATAAPDDASVVVNNPAAMAWLKGAQFQADVTAIDFSTHFHGGGTDAMGRPLTGGNGGNGGTTIPVPAFFFSMPINDQWSVGAAVSAPFGFQTQWNNGWVGRYSALFSKLQSIDATFSVSYKVTDSLAVGGSLIAQRTSADLSNAVNFGAILAPAAAPAFLPQSADGYAELQAHNWKWGWQLGASWKPTDTDTVAFDYHAEIKHHLNGQATFVVPPAVQGAFAQSPLTASLFTNTGGSTDYATPAFASLSYWHVFNDQFSAGADLDWTGWSNFKQLAVNFNNPAQPQSVEVFNWADSYFFSIGGDYKLTDRLTLRGGLAVDGTPTYQLTRDPRVPDASRRWLSLGLGYKATDNFEVNVGYAHLFVGDSHINTLSPTGDRLTGYFSNSADLLALSGTYKF